MTFKKTFFTLSLSLFIIGCSANKVIFPKQIEYNTYSQNVVDAFIPFLQSKGYVVLNPNDTRMTTSTANGFLTVEYLETDWFNSGVFVSTGGLTIMGLADTNVPGIMLIVTSILIMLYSTIVYYRRNDSLVNRYATGYNDLYGPLILTFIMIISLILSVIFYD